MLREHVAEYFELDVDSPYMLLVAPVSAKRRIAMTDEQQRLFGIDKLNVPRSDIPAVTHVDYSARIQTVHAETQPALPRAAHRASTRSPAVPCSSTPASTCAASRSSARREDAYLCFMRTEMDTLVLGSFVLEKSRQPELKQDVDWRTLYQLD